MSFLDRAGLDAKSWLTALRRTTPVLMRGLSGFLLAWLLLRVWTFETDKTVMLAIYDAGSSAALPAWIIAEVGSLLWMPLVGWLYVFRRKNCDWTSAVLVAVGTIMSMVIVDLLKAAFMLPRPPDALPGLVEYRLQEFGMPTNYAFPSGHTSRAFTLATIVWARYSKWKIPFAALAVATGLSMIIIGYHFPSDVLGGAFVGIMIGTFMANLAKVRAH